MTNSMTLSSAISILEKQFSATYSGTSTVREMSTDLISAISFEGENPNDVYHNFKTESGPNTIVKEDQILKLAVSYSSKNGN